MGDNNQQGREKTAAARAKRRRNAENCQAAHLIERGWGLIIPELTAAGLITDLPAETLATVREHTSQPDSKPAPTQDRQPMD